MQSINEGLSSAETMLVLPDFVLSRLAIGADEIVVSDGDIPVAVFTIPVAADIGDEDDDDDDDDELGDMDQAEEAIIDKVLDEDDENSDDDDDDNDGVENEE